MSVALLVESPLGNQLTPIATEAVFAQYWLTAALELGLRWVPLFQSGLPIPLADRDDVLTELRCLRQHWVARGEAALTERLERLIGALEAVDYAQATAVTIC